MINQNESKLANTVFKIQPNKADSLFLIVCSILQLFVSLEPIAQSLWGFNQINPNLTVGWVGKVRKKTYLPKEEGREGGEKKRTQRARRARARTRDLPRARRGSPAACHGGCSD